MVTVGVPDAFHLLIAVICMAAFVGLRKVEEEPCESVPISLGEEEECNKVTNSSLDI